MHSCSSCSVIILDLFQPSDPTVVSICIDKTQDPTRYESAITLDVVFLWDVSKINMFQINRFASAK